MYPGAPRETQRWDEGPAENSAGAFFPKPDAPPRWPSSVDRQELEEVAAAYLRLPLLASPSLDWALINGFLRYYVDEYDELMASGRLHGEFRWARYISMGHPTLESILAGLGFICWVSLLALDWLFLPVLALYLLQSGSPPWSLIVVALAIVQIVARVTQVPKLLQRQRRRTEKETALEDLLDLKWAAGCQIVNPTDLWNRVREFERNHPSVYLWPISSILARAVARDPAHLEFWTASDGFVPSPPGMKSTVE